MAVLISMTEHHDLPPGGPGYGGGHQGERGPARSWWDKAKDQLAAWLGDARARRRREWDKVRGDHPAQGPGG